MGNDFIFDRKRKRKIWGEGGNCGKAEKSHACVTGMASEADFMLKREEKKRENEDISTERYSRK